jgi:serine/threonine protein phosphatase PrpC
VLQMVDELGNPVGPFRVWKENEACPGLAMSRSIGDMIGAEVGVISTPICTSHELRSCDKFLVIASDGVWDVMENEEVVQFVEVYRKQCIDSNDLPALNKQKIQPNNASIAQLLCEEARMRWFSIVEEEDTMIDDISCIILEAEDLGNHEYKENSSALIKLDGSTECRGSESNLFLKTFCSPAVLGRVS